MGGEGGGGRRGADATELGGHEQSNEGRRPSILGTACNHCAKQQNGMLRFSSMPELLLSVHGPCSSQVHVAKEFVSLFHKRRNWFCPLVTRYVYSSGQPVCKGSWLTMRQSSGNTVPLPASIGKSVYTSCYHHVCL